MIGVFDSGIGGLTVVKEIFRQLPQYQILYFGDTARTPYGNRGEEVIKKYALEDAEILIKHGAKIIVVACNTASAVAYNYLQKNIKIPVFEVVTPAVNKAVNLTKKNRIGIIGTRATINSQIYSRLIREQKPQIEVWQQATPLLVPLVEEGWTKKSETKQIIKKYLQPLKVNNVDVLILACTHYPFLKEVIKYKVSKQTRLVDPAEETISSLKDFLGQHLKIEKTLIKNDQHRFLVSDLTSKFQNLSSRWLDRNIKLEKINLC